MDQLSWIYFPTALLLGGLHAIEPGHAKTLTAAYLIGIKGTKKDAFLLGLSVAITHSLVVILISVAALYVGKEAFTEDVTHYLQKGSGIVVILLGAWLMLKQYLYKRKHDGHHHHHPHCTHEIPDYVKRGEKPTLWQIFTFGAAGGMIPCPASITVMLLALSVGQVGLGLFTVMGFSLGLAITLVTVGLIVVTGISRIQQSGRSYWLSLNAPMISAFVVILSGFAALLIH